MVMIHHMVNMALYGFVALPKLHSRTAAANPTGRWTGTFPIGEPSRTRCGVACPRQSWSPALQVPGRAGSRAGNKEVSIKNTWFTGDYVLTHRIGKPINQLVFHEIGKRGIFNGSNRFPIRSYAPKRIQKGRTVI